MAGVDSLRNGYIWRVGTGQKINIWTDAWIPNCANRRFITPRRGILLTKVSDLIDPTTNDWDEDLVRQTLWPPLPMHNMQDFIARSYTKNGLLTVRSAYLEEWNKQHGMKLGYTNGMGRSRVNPIWGKICKLACLAKVNFFNLAHIAWDTTVSYYPGQWTHKNFTQLPIMFEWARGYQACGVSVSEGKISAGKVGDVWNS